MESYALAAFRSRQAVLRFEEELRRAGGPTRVTTPRAVSLGCGLSVRFDRIALPIALQIYRARPSAARNLIGFYTAQELDGKLMIQSVRF